MNKIKLLSLRSKINHLDNKIFNLIKKRTKIVNQMLKLKQNKNQIVDRKRIYEILEMVRSKSVKNKIDPKITNRIWKSMIWSYIDYQKRNFKKK